MILWHVITIQNLWLESILLDDYPVKIVVLKNYILIISGVSYTGYNTDYDFVIQS